ncbi:glycosyl hydrolase family 28 protein [Pedobacter sp. MC2016-15]|uniref:glycoside hydrolase family 28 protein n=1 Tax=Pedobacter sp. MC2016-15 TaxID=2994473 RepID=UPI002245F882|nr:glycosyl hydrolase family 28 protein [Pedobacter sp. MC2016-15]MCX2480992.1 glycosyl hydrolase family 28 protein [Pedobacter sp. MC2016-15]
MKTKLLILLYITFSIPAIAQKRLNIKDFGARTGLDFNNASIIQEAIDQASASGGGIVTVPEGNYLSGPLVLKSNVELHLEKNAILWGSAKRNDYTAGKMAIISAVGQHHIRISGKGTIDGQGRELVQNTLLLLRAGEIRDHEWLAKRPGEDNRTNLIYFKGCKDVSVTGITLKNASSWVQNYKECEGVVIDSMTVNSICYWNNDGIDIVDSKKVRISNSSFNAADDAICLKSEISAGSCEDILVENCTLRSSASGFKLGTGSVGGFRKVTVKNLTVFDTYRSAIALETVDGAFLEDVDIDGVNAKNTGNAIFIRLGHRNKDSRFSTLKNVSIRNVKVEVPAGKPDIGYPMEGPLPKVSPHNLLPASVTGLPGHEVENVKLENIEIVYGGGASKERAFVSLDALDKVTENEAGYPEFTMFSELPSWGLYTRHAKNMTISNIKLRLRGEDFRPALVFDDVKKLSLDKIDIPAESSAAAIIVKNVEGLKYQNSKAAVKKI